MIGILTEPARRRVPRPYQATIIRPGRFRMSWRFQFAGLNQSDHALFEAFR